VLQPGKQGNGDMGEDSGCQISREWDNSRGMKGYDENLPGNYSDWQNKQFRITRILNEEPKRANEKQGFQTKRLLEFYWQNTAFLRFKMSLFGAVWLADLRFYGLE
jgi:hypothetical protein